MLRSYIVIALRHLLRDKLATAINIAGLSVSIAISLILGIAVYLLVTSDQHIAEDGRLYRMVAREVAPDSSVLNTSLQREDLAAALGETFPEVESATRVVRGDMLMSVGDAHLEEEVVSVDPAFLHMFGYQLAAGDRATALDDPASIVLSQPLAQRLFGPDVRPTELIGQTLLGHGNQGTVSYSISGVFDNLPRAGSLQFQAAINFDNWRRYGWSNRWDSATSTYVRVGTGADVDAMQEKLRSFSRAFVESKWDAYKDSRWLDDPDAFRLWMQPVSAIRLDATVHGAYESSVGRAPVYLLIGMIGLILAIACINYTTLAIAGSMRRTSEVGVRKSLGAGTSHLVGQFLGEGFVLTLLSVVCGVGLAVGGLPLFNQWYGLSAGQGLSLSDVEMPVLLGAGVGLILLIGIVAGSYPAAMAARRPAVVTVRGGTRQRHRVTRVLLTAQYAMAILFMFCTLVIQQQMSFAQQRDLGYDGEQVLVVRLRGPDSESTGRRFLQAASQVPGVVQTALADREFANSTSTAGLRTPSGDRASVYQFAVSGGFFETLGVKLLDGRTFVAGRDTDREDAVIINQRMAQLYGWQDGAVGQRLPQFGNGGISDTPVVIGVVPDFHFRSLKETIAPAIFHYGKQTGYYRALVRLQARDAPATLAALKEAWVEVEPELPFETEFFDDAFARQYQDDEEMRRTMNLGSLIAIITACMGLFGQAAISVQHRTREIGIRKALGATVTQVCRLLSRDVVKLVLVASLIGLPLATLLMTQYLEMYVYRIDLGPLLFLACGSIALLIALTTVGYVGVRAALASPLASLRHE